MRTYFAPKSELQSVFSGQMYRMMLVVGLLVGLCVWARHFIIEGILSNVYLNAGIVAVFVMGIVLSFRRLMSLWNEDIAFQALQEAFQDLRAEQLNGTDDPYWKHYRALKPGRVFSKPKILSHSFELTYDEMLRNRSIRMSVGTMQSIMSSIDAKLAEDRSLLSYLTGLLVFLGLIGTFIGLMEMVSSVGGIIGRLNTGASQTSAAIGGLLKSLEDPLRGMATGFSSSLFGLFGSLVVGLMMRMSGTGATALKHAFESWLASVAQIEGSGSDDAGNLARLVAENVLNPGGTGGNAGQATSSGITDVGIVATMAQGFGRTNSSIEKIADMVPRMMEVQSEQIALIRTIATSLERLAGDTGELRGQMITMTAGQATTTELMQEMININRSMETRLTSGFNGMAHVMEVTGQAYLDGLRRLTSENYETNARLAKLLDLKAAGDRIAEVAVGIESKVKNGMGSLVATLERTAVSIESSMQRFTTEQAELKAIMASRSGGQVGITPEFEEKLTNGFSEMSRSFETVFAAYSTVLNRAVLSQALGDSDGQPIGGPLHAPAAKSSIPEHTIKTETKEAVDIDHDEMRDRLYKMASSMMTNRSTG
jgi:hypothetical protein